MKKLIIVSALLVSSFIVKASEIRVIAQGKPARVLTAAQIAKVLSSHNQLAKSTLANFIKGGTIRNNDGADAILAIIR
jgi:hypothetical protein